jgi:hypothetical protein
MVDGGGATDGTETVVEEGNCVFVWFVVFLFCLVVRLARDVLSLFYLLL